MTAKIEHASAVREQDPLLPLETMVSNILRYGVLLAAATMVAGIVLLVVERGPGAIITLPRGSALGAGAAPASATDLLRRLSTGHPTTVIDLGLILLIATPVFRVGVSIIAFALERDWLYTWITAFVFAMLMLGFAIGRA
jgi:uncharacterized membrane protein